MSAAIGILSVELLHLLLLEQRADKGRSVDRHLLGQLVEPVLDLVFAFNTLLLHLLLDLLELFLLLLVELLLFLGVFILGCARDLEFEFLLDLLISLVLGLGVFLLELGDFVLLLLLELLQLLLRLVNDLFHFRINHHLLHFQAHLRLETEATKFTLGLPNGHLVVLDGWLGFGCGVRASCSLTGFVQELDDL